MTELKDVVLYTKKNCTYCDKAKQLLQSRNIPYRSLTLDEDFTREWLLGVFPSAKTFPVVLVNSFYIGGFTQLASIITLEEQQNASSTEKLLNE